MTKDVHELTFKRGKMKMKKEKYTPMDGDRVLVTGDRVMLGGRTADIRKATLGGQLTVVYDDGGWTWLRDDDVFTLLYRPPARIIPPRPEVESFIRSDGAEIFWYEERPQMPSGAYAGTADDALKFARMYTQAAERFKWEQENAASA